VLAAGTTPATDFTLTAKTLIDLEARFDFTDHIRAAFGADNLTDEYPDANPAPLLNPNGTQSFNNYSPFGRSGRFVYGKLNYRF
jgi:iron complex outermembrane receptor protein